MRLAIYDAPITTCTRHVLQCVYVVLFSLTSVWLLLGLYKMRSGAKTEIYYYTKIFFIKENIHKSKLKRIIKKIKKTKVKSLKNTKSN